MVERRPSARDEGHERKGIRRVLGDREASIMEVVWNAREATVREIHAALGCKTHLAYTTVMTITDRLRRKGLLRRQKRGNAYVYCAEGSRESFVASCVHRLLDAFLPDLNEAALSRFVDGLAQEQPELLARLERIVRTRKGAP